MDNNTPLTINLYATTGCDLLWVRPEGVLGGFIPQTIQVDSYGYKFLLVIHNTTKGTTSSLILNDAVSPYTQIIYDGLQRFRVVTVGENELTFSGVYTGEISDDTITTNSVSYAMPYHIYGIR